jgi:hypothetical protein
LHEQTDGKVERVSIEASIAAKPAARLYAVIAIAIAVALAGGLALGTTAAEAKFKQPGCAKFKKKIKKAKSKAAKKKLKRKFRQCRANRTVYNQVKNSRFVGAREDGEPVDLIFCANGKMADDLDSPFGEVYRKGWRITDARIRGKNFTAVYEALISKSKVGSTQQVQIATRAGSLAKKRGKWQSGTESFGRPDLLGDVTKTSAKKECRKL